MSAKLSDFYLACQSNDTLTVKTLLSSLSLDEINRIEANGSTALHAASYYGHYDIVKLLLEKPGVVRSLKNTFKCTPCDEAATFEIKKLFDRQATATASDHSRFIGETDKIEWLDIYQNAYRIALENHNYMKRWLTKVPLKKLMHEIDTDYIDRMNFQNHSDYQLIKSFMQKAIETGEPLWLIKAYTAETSFYSKLNENLARLGSDFRFESIHSHLGASYKDNEPPVGLGQYLFASIIINHCSFEDYYYTGQTYRGMNIHGKDLKQYVAGSSIMTRSFLSTSKLRQVATQFLVAKRFNPITGSIIRLPVLCIYNIKNDRTALYIKEFSEYESEEEVLIAPFTAFAVTKIVENDEVFMEIHLEECKPK